VTRPLFRRPGPVHTAATRWALRRPWRTRLLRRTPLWSPSVELAVTGERAMRVAVALLTDPAAMEAAIRAARERSST
jgi:hypothetical protein